MSKTIQQHPLLAVQALDREIAMEQGFDTWFRDTPETERLVRFDSRELGAYDAALSGGRR